MPTLLFALVVALAEESVFRGLLTPARVDSPTRRSRTIAALAAFVGWHALQGWMWPPARRVFWRRDFLLATIALGGTCTMLRIVSGSIWPGVAVHAGAIVAWRGLLGGPTFSDLRGVRP